MRNFRHNGDRMTVVAPAAVSAGALVVVGQMFGVAEASANSGANVAIRCGGVVDLKKLAGASTAFTQGANVHLDAANAQCTVSATSNTKIGVAAVAAANAATVATVRLNGSF